MDTSTIYLTIAALLATLGLSVLFLPTSFAQWLKRKNYQYEVTFSLYMLTPTEKFVFNSILFLTISMLTIATAVYFPNHIATITRRAYYYFAGDTEIGDNSRTAAAAAQQAREAGEAVLGVGKELAGKAYEATMGRAAEKVGWS